MRKIFFSFFLDSERSSQGLVRVVDGMRWQLNNPYHRHYVKHEAQFSLKTLDYLATTVHQPFMKFPAPSFSSNLKQQQL